MKGTQLKSQTSKAEFVPELKAVFNAFSNRMSTHDFIALSNSALDKLVAHQCDKLIADTTELGTMGNDKQAFIKQQWYPKAVEIGLKKLAFVIPVDVFGKYGLDTTNKNYDGPIDMKYFSSLDDAIAWIKE